MHELKNKLVTSAEQHAQECLSMLPDQASRNDLLTNVDARFSWHCDLSQEASSCPTSETFELTIDTSYLKFPICNEEDLELGCFDEG